MTTWQIAVVSALEAVAVFLVARLWLRHRKLGISRRLLWSVLLLVPVLGIALYMAWFTEPEEKLFDTYAAQKLGEIVEEGEDPRHD